MSDWFSNYWPLKAAVKEPSRSAEQNCSLLYSELLDAVRSTIVF